MPANRVRLGREAARLAQRALDARGGLPPSRRYGTPAGLAQARRIARGEPVDAARTRAFLARFRRRILDEGAVAELVAVADKAGRILARQHVLLHVLVVALELEIRRQANPNTWRQTMKNNVWCQ